MTCTILGGSCWFRPMASSPTPSSPPHQLNLIEFNPNQIESHKEIIPCSFFHCLIRLLVVRQLGKNGGKLEIGILQWGQTRHGAKPVSFYEVRVIVN